MKQYKVYLYEFQDGKVYIGMTHLSIQKRRDCGYQHNKKLTDAIKSCGWENVKKVVLEDGMTKQEAEEKEIYYINHYNATSPEFGYNVSFGGKKTFKGLHHTDEHKSYMSEILKGKRFTKQHIEALKASHANERHPVIRLDSEGIAMQYASLRDAAKSVNGYATNIARACQKGNKMYKGFYWRKGVINGGTATVR